MTPPETHTQIGPRVRNLSEWLLLLLATVMVVSGVWAGFTGVRPFLGYVKRAYVKAYEKDKLSELSPSDVAEGGFKHLRDEERYVKWWAGRRRPWIVRGGFLEVLNKRPLDNTLGTAVAAIVLDEQKKRPGVNFDLFYLPTNFGPMVGNDVALEYTQTDGTKVELVMAHPAKSFAHLSGIDTLRRPYAAVLDEEELAALSERVRLTKRMKRVWIAEVEPGNSGTWVVMSHPIEKTALRREFYILPLETVQGLTSK